MRHGSLPRVYITGVGPITAFGVGPQPLWDAMLAGRSAIKPIARFDASGFPCRAAAELADELFDVQKVVPKSHRKATKVMARDIELAVGAADAAVRDAGLVTRGISPEAEPTIPGHRVGCHIGAGLIAADIDELSAALATSRDASGSLPGGFDLAHWGQAGMQNLTPLWLLKYLPNMLACHVTIIHDCRGPSNTITCAEASSALSIGESMRVIQRGAADACLSGGAEYKLNPMGILRQQVAGRLAATNGLDPAHLVKPFDPMATGTILGEGGGILILESESSATGRGVSPYAEIAGFAATQSWCEDTVGLAIEPDGRSICDAIEIALAAAKLDADAIDAIAPFGSGIPHIDHSEAAAIRSVFGSRSESIPLITTIPNVGNCCAGASAISTAVASLALRHQALPARINTIAAEGLDANAAPSRPAALRHVLVLTTSMGGQNAALILRKV